MKITTIEVLGQNLKTAFIRVKTDGGITGIGATSAPPPVIEAIINSGPDSLRHFIEGEDPTHLNDLWRKMSLLWLARRGRGGEGGLAVNAMAAVDLALWDIWGKTHNMPIYKLLGGSLQDEIMAYASSQALDLQSKPMGKKMRLKPTDVLVREAKDRVNEGFKAIKFGWGDNFRSEDESAMAAIREAVGPDIRLMLDFGCPVYHQPGLTVKDAIKRAKIMEGYDYFFFEEALHPYNVEGFRALTKQVNIKIATGESLTTVDEFKPFIFTHAVDIIQPDAQQMGFTQFLHVTRMAEDANILCVPHGPWSPILIAAHLNALATTRNGIMIEYPSPDVFPSNSTRSKYLKLLFERGFENTLKLRNGFIQLPDAPGLGLGDYNSEVFKELNSLGDD